MPKDYIPIDCNYYDELLLAVLNRRSVEITYEVDGLTEQIQDTIIDVFTSEGAEYITTSSGLRIRLDHLISVDGKRSPNSPVQDF